MLFVNHALKPKKELNITLLSVSYETRLKKLLITEHCERQNREHGFASRQGRR
jgi:hypothetical protein